MNNKLTCHPETPESGQQKCGTCAYYHEKRICRGMPDSFCSLWGQVRLPQYNACDYHTPRTDFPDTDKQ